MTEPTCQFCRWWLAYDAPAGTAGNGECLRLGSGGSRARLRLLNGGPDMVGCLVTHFDFGCNQWQPVPQELPENGCQQKG
jgi:hypothetical protein